MLFLFIHLSLACESVYNISSNLFNIGHFQLKLDSFFNHDGRPPYKESFFLVQAHRNATETSFLLETCPGAIVSSYLVVAEHSAFTHGVRFAEEKNIVPAMSVINSLSDSSRNDALLLWPIAKLFDKLKASLESQIILENQNFQSHYQPSLTFIICHCREDLSWISQNIKFIPPNSALFIYEKCKQNSTDFLTETAANIFDRNIYVIDRPDGEVRGDECSGFLTHLTSFYDQLTDYTILLQSDPNHHLFFSYLDVVLRGISIGSYHNIPFLHLNFHRHVTTSTPCMRSVESVLYSQTESDISQLPLIQTYCCSQFIVTKDRILSHSKEFYTHMLYMVDGTYPDLCVKGKPVRSSQCYIFEFLWHIVFGEPRILPMRVDDLRLPNALRMKYGNEHVRVWWKDLDMAPGEKRVLEVEKFAELENGIELPRTNHTENISVVVASE
jgi:Protein of unknown function (DUF3431)